MCPGPTYRKLKRPSFLALKRDLEFGNHVAGLVLHGDADEWIDANKLHLHVLPVVGHPLPLHQLLDHDGVHCLVLDRVVRRRTCLALLVVRDAFHLQKVNEEKLRLGKGNLDKMPEAP